MKFLRRSLVLCLALMLCFSAFIVSAGAIDETFSETYGEGAYSFTFTVKDENTVSLTSMQYTSGTELTIPAEVTNEGKTYKVVWDSYKALMNTNARNSIETIIVEDGITALPSTAFGGYKALKTITIPESVTSIGSSAFKLCTSLSSVTIPAGVTDGIRDIVFSSGTTLAIPNPEILEFEEGSPYSNVDGVLYKTVEGVVSAELLLDRDAESVTIKGDTTEIANAAFANTGLTSVSFAGNNLKKIGSDAFSNCKNLTSITLPEGVEEIGAVAFLNCEKLATLELPSSLTSIGSAAFGGCDELTELTIPAKVTDGLYEALSGGQRAESGRYPHLDNVKVAAGSPYSIEDGVLYKGETLVYLLDQDATSIEVREGTKEIAENALSFTYVGLSNLKSVTFADDSLEVIGPSAFFGCAIENIVLPSSVTTIGESAFEGCSDLTNVTLPAGVTTISKSAFETCTSLETINLENITEIEAEAFYNCGSLKRVVLSDGLTTIGEMAFNVSAEFGTGLEYINIPSTVNSLGDHFATMSDNAVIVSSVTDANIFTSNAITGFGDATLIYPAEYADSYRKNEALTENGFVSEEGNDDLTYSLNLPASLNLLDVETKTIEVTIPDGYNLVMSNSDDTVATAELSDDNKTITVKALKNGSTTISVSIVSNDGDIMLVTKSCRVVVGASYTITIVYGNGTADSIEYIPQGESYKLPSAPTKPGYIFMGWRGADGTVYQPYDVVEISSDTSFKAVWANMPDITPGTPDEPDDEPDVDVFPFYDVSAGAWYYDAVKYAWEHELMNGVTATEFSPNTTLNRAMIWTMLARLDGVNTDGGASWYAKAQEWAMAEGVSDGTDPMGAVTREQLVTMLWRFKGEPAVDFLLTSPDADTISDWAREAMRWAVSNGIIEGDENGCITPTATATRAQAAAIFMRFVEQ